MISLILTTLIVWSLMAGVLMRVCRHVDEASFRPVYLAVAPALVLCLWAAARFVMV